MLEILEIFLKLQDNTITVFICFCYDIFDIFQHNNNNNKENVD